MVVFKICQFSLKTRKFSLVVSSQINFLSVFIRKPKLYNSPFYELKMAATGSTQTEGQADASAANTNRVWVGNLAYKSSEQDLRDAFAGMKM
jgi:RNA recognition motif-containing protein